MTRGLNYNTPTQLQEKGVAPNLGTVMLERGWMSWKDRESKKFLLRVAWVLPAAQAIPRPGDPEKRHNGASQMLMGDMLGQDRSTTNRDIALFCGPNALIVQLFNKWRPGIGCVNRYSNRKSDAAPEPTPKTVLKTHDPAELARLHGEELFDRELAGLSGSGPVALWTYDENIPRTIRCVCRKGQMKFNFRSDCMKCGGKGFTFDPEGRKMGANPRIVLTVLQLKGIAGIQKPDGSYTPPYLDMTCEQIGDLCGMCVNTVADALDQCEDQKLLQIIPGTVIYDRAGAVIFRYPQRIIWLPGMLLDLNIVQRERERFAACLAETVQRANLNGWESAGTHLTRIAALHNELLNRWTMGRHSLGAFWNAMRTLIRREGIPCVRGRRDGRDGRLGPDYRALLFPFHLKE